MRVLILLLALCCPALYAYPDHSPMDFEPIPGGISGEGVTTRFWDCTSGACSSPASFDNPKVTPVKACATDGVTKAETGSIGYACNDEQPWAVNSTLAYGYAAFSAKGGADTHKCCACVKLDFQVCPALYAYPENSPAVHVEPIVGGDSGKGITTRYWDCCKPACAWPSMDSKRNPVKSCAIDGITKVNPFTATACARADPKQDAYACNDQRPWAINSTLALGFAAYSAKGGADTHKCCACMKLDFQEESLKGKSMIVQVTNTGSDLQGTHFDIAMPGGGVGIYNACDLQWNAPKDGWGDRYGGVHTRKECDALPKQIRDGCYFRFDFLLGVEDPPIVYKEVTCPKELTEISGCIPE